MTRRAGADSADRRRARHSRRGSWCRFCCSSKGASLVASTRGAAGGYRLARSPHDISLAEVIDVMEGDDRPQSNAAKPTPLVRIAGLCRDLGDVQRDRLDATSLADLVEQAADREPMWYI